MILIADVFPKLRAPKSMFRYLSKKTYFGELLEKQHGKRAQTILKSEGQCFYHIYWSLSRQLSCKKSLLLIWKILRVVVNAFTADEKYSVLNRDNVMQPIHMQLWREQKTFSQFSFSIFETYIKFGTFSKKKMTLIAYVFPKLPNPKNVVRKLPKKSSFGGPFHKQHGKEAQALLESERQKFYHIFR